MYSNRIFGLDNEVGDVDDLDKISVQTYFFFVHMDAKMGASRHSSLISVTVQDVHTFTMQIPLYSVITV